MQIRQNTSLVTHRSKQVCTCWPNFSRYIRPVALLKRYSELVTKCNGISSFFSGVVTRCFVTSQSGYAVSEPRVALTNLATVMVNCRISLDRKLCALHLDHGWEIEDICFCLDDLASESLPLAQILLSMAVLLGQRLDSRPKYHQSRCSYCHSHNLHWRFWLVLGWTLHIACGWAWNIVSQSTLSRNLMEAVSLGKFCTNWL